VNIRSGRVGDLIIGGTDAACLEYLRQLVLVEPRSLYHYETFHVAEVEGTPAALGGFLLEADRWAKVSQALSRVQQEAKVGLRWANERAGFRFSDEKRCENLKAALGTPGFIRLVAHL